MEVNPIVVVFNQRKTTWETSERTYIQENVNYLDIYLCNDHNEEIYRGVGGDRANQRPEFDAIRVPNDDEECRQI